MTSNIEPLIMDLVLSPDIFDYSDLSGMKIGERYTKTKEIFRSTAKKYVKLINNKVLFDKYKENVNKFCNNNENNSDYEQCMIDMKRWILHLANNSKKTDKESQYCELVSSNLCFGVCSGAEKCNKCSNFKMCANIDKSDEINKIIFKKREYHYDEETNIDVMKKEIFEPMVKSGQKAVIYDSVIGTTVDDYSCVKDNYSYNIKYWLKEFFKMNNNINIEIWTSFNYKKLEETKSAVLKLGKEIKKENNNINFKFLLIPLKTMDHERYFLVDNALCLNIGRGIDLINNKTGLLRISNISIVEDRQKVQNLISHKFSKKSELVF